MSKINEGELMAALRTPAAKKSVRSVAVVKPAVPKTGRGKPINIYLHPADQDRIRKLVAYLSAQDKRVSDSQVIKAALQVAEGNADLLKALEVVVERDQRFKKVPDAKD